MLNYMVFREHPLIPTDLKIRTMFGFGWVGGSRQNGCSDLKIRWFQMFQDQRIFLLWMFGSWGGWVGHYKSEHCSDF